jgi:hypothetical protein
VVDQEASLTVGLGKPPANRHLVGLCELLRLGAFFSLVRLLIAVALKGDPLTYARADRAARAGKRCSSRQKGIVGALDVLGARSRSDYEIQAVAVGTSFELEK